MTHTLPVTRRILLQRAAQLGVLGAAGPLAMSLAGISDAAALEGDDYRAIVCVFLYGGNDYANTVTAYDARNYAAYSRIRGAIAIPRDQLAATALTPRDGQVLTDDLQFALAPSLPRLKALFDAGKAGVQLNVGPLIMPLTLAQYQSNNRASYPLPPKLFSHNDQQSIWQSLGSEGATIGWGGRLGDRAMASNGQSMLTCVSAAGNAVFVSGASAAQYQISAEGAIRFNIINEPQYANPAISAALRDIITRPSEHAFENELTTIVRRSIAMEGVVNSALDKVSINTEFGHREGRDGQTSLTDQMRIIARLIGARTDLGAKRQIFFASLGGFDHHNDLMNKHPALMAELDEAVGAFYAATEELGVADKVTTFTASDFGRTLSFNSDGSDHGWGSHHFIVGGAVRGGRFFGTAPHISIQSDDQVGQGRLLPSTSIDQFAATLARWFGVPENELPSVLPNIGNFSGADMGYFNAPV